MAELQRFPLTTTNGETGYVLRRARFIDPAEQSRVILDDGTELTAPSNSLEPLKDGTFLFHSEAVSTPASAQAQAPPEPRQVSHEARTEPASRIAAPPPPPASTSYEALFADEVGIERVSVNEIVDEPPANRQEGDVLVIPVVEEILVVQKRYMIKEEIRINRSRHPVAEPRRVVLDGVHTRS